MHLYYRILFSLLALFSFCLVLYSFKQQKNKKEDYSGWSTFAGTKDGSRYSALDQITKENVNRLEIAWSYSTKDKDTANRSQIQCNPIMVNGILYGTSPRLKLFALNAATGKELWVFDPHQNKKDKPLGINRGVVYWEDEKGKNKRLFYAVSDKLYAIDAEVGQPVTSFGQGGTIDLDEGLDRQVADGSVASATPGIVYKDVLILGSRLSETAEAAPGHIRAFDCRTGKRRWIFHTIPHPGEKGYTTWKDKNSWKKNGGANNWAGMSLDEERGIVYVPTGSATYDFWGGNRKGQNLFANSLIALEAATGKYIWHFQTVHHDLWDRDLPANPNLVTVTHNGNKVDAVAQVTKTGHTFLFNRLNGKPLFPVKEVPVPPSDMPGEEAWPTQPIPLLPEPFTRQLFREQDVTTISPESHKAMLQKFKSVKSGHTFTPPSKKGTIIFPGFDGGAEWGGAAIDPQTGWLYINANEMPWILQLIDLPKNTRDRSVQGVGKTVYNKYCITCHGANLKGDAQQTFPSLQNIHKKYKQEELKSIINNGRNRMPPFKHIPEGEKNALLAFLLKLENKEMTGPSTNNKKNGAQDEVPYTSTGYNRMLDKNGYPGIKPPWGTLNAIDLNTGKLIWKVPLGEYEELKKKGISPTGTENYGGPLVTAGGILFIAASRDEYFRAFDKETGALLWEHKLPAAGYATPCTYSIDGKQYVVIAAGGGKSGTQSGDQYLAFALPDK